MEQNKEYLLKNRVAIKLESISLYHWQNDVQLTEILMPAIK